MRSNNIIIGAFVKRYKIASFLEYLTNKFYLDLDKVNVYEMEDNEIEYLVTIKTTKDLKDRYNIYDSTVMHTKKGCLFSINALNALIDFEKKKENSNVDNKDYRLDWSKYRNKLIMFSNYELRIKDLNKIEDKSIFFKE